MSRKIIGVFGAGNVTESDGEYELALEVGGQLAREGFAVLTGGLEQLPAKVRKRPAV